jgi:hypothetical protein
VVPAVPTRHWICSLPWGQRALLGYERQLCSEVVSSFVGELGRSLRWRAKDALGLASVERAFTGAVAAVQRSDSALRLNVHFHVLALDGVGGSRSGARSRVGGAPARDRGAPGAAISAPTALSRERHPGSSAR